MLFTVGYATAIYNSSLYHFSTSRNTNFLHTIVEPGFLAQIKVYVDHIHNRRLGLIVRLQNILHCNLFHLDLNDYTILQYTYTCIARHI